MYIIILFYGYTIQGFTVFMIRSEISFWFYLFNYTSCTCCILNVSQLCYTHSGKISIKVPDDNLCCCYENENQPSCYCRGNFIDVTIRYIHWTNSYVGSIYTYYFAPFSENLTNTVMHWELNLVSHIYMPTGGLVKGDVFQGIFNVDFPSREDRLTESNHTNQHQVLFNLYIRIWLTILMENIIYLRTL